MKEIIGKRLKELRDSLKLSQAKIANQCGTTQTLFHN